MLLKPKPNFSIIGHRGLPSLAPENTLTSFIRASEFGLSWVEFDVLRTATHEWVVIHDDTLERTTNGKGRVDEKSFEYIKNLDAGSWFNPTFKNEKVPLLKDVLDCLLAHHLHPNIEIKKMRGNARDLMQDLANFLQANWPDTHEPPLISSFDIDLLFALQAVRNDLPLGYITRDFNEVTLSTAQRFKFASVHCTHESVLRAPTTLLEKARNLEIAVLAYTVNTLDEYKTLIEKGVSAVFSDTTEFLTWKKQP